MRGEMNVERNQVNEIKKDQIRIDVSDGEVINCIEECTKSSESKICGELRREESKEESEQLERSGDMEEKVGGEIRKKFKENGRKIFGVEGQHTRSREAKLEEKQTRGLEFVVVKGGKTIYGKEMEAKTPRNKLKRWTISSGADASSESF